MLSLRATRRPLGFAALGALGLMGGVLLSTSVEAQPTAPAGFCEAYPDIAACSSGEASCTTCHSSPPTLNAYGVDIAANLSPSEERPLHADVFDAGLGEALLAVEELDSDGDGWMNLDELEAGTDPSDAGSLPQAAECTDLDPDDGWNLCGYDMAYTYKKVHLDFCGHSPTLAEREAFDEDPDQEAALHEALDACLDSEFWRGKSGRVWNLANKKIGPIAAVKSGLGAGPIPLADYDDDYAYWTWTQTDDRDVRLVLTGQTFITASFTGGETVFEEWDRRPNQDAQERGDDAYQAVRKEKRAGLLTHRWFLMSNTMFTSLPRTTAAQAYRAFLGYDISRLEGLAPVSGEPVDYDTKGVAEEACAVCHSTLDPLTYPFSRYEGIGGGSGGGYSSYSYNDDRLERFTSVDGELVAETPEAGMLFGEPVEDLVEWAEVAANSDAFRRATVRDYWVMLLGEEPRATEQADFGQLVSDLGGEHDWQVEKMLHALIDTEAYGAP